MRVVPVPLLSDNYGYLIIDSAGACAFVVDPAEPKKMIEAAKKENVKIVGVLTTHHHWYVCCDFCSDLMLFCFC